MAKHEFAAAPILNLTLIGLESGDVKRPTSRNRAHISGRFGVATVLYRALEGLRTHLRYTLPFVSGTYWPFLWAIVDGAELATTK
jgi:hypothetical protein